MESSQWEGLSEKRVQDIIADAYTKPLADHETSGGLGRRRAQHDRGRDKKTRNGWVTIVNWKCIRGKQLAKKWFHAPIEAAK